jgi:hypothetical protein
MCSPIWTNIAFHGWHRFVVGQSLQQRRNLRGALGGDDAEFGGMATQRIDRSGALPDQQLTMPEDHAVRLLLGALDRHCRHIGP